MAVVFNSSSVWGNPAQSQHAVAMGAVEDITNKNKATTLRANATARLGDGLARRCTAAVQPGFNAWASPGRSSHAKAIKNLLVAERIAKIFVKHMRAFQAQPNAIRRDETAARQAWLLDQHRSPRQRKLRLSDVKERFEEMRP
jgi:hypothetical protein